MKTNANTNSAMNKVRALIAAGSFAGFIGGWVLLAQAGAPAVAASSAGTVPSQAPGVVITATIAAATTTGAARATSTPAPTTAAGKAKATSTPVPTATAKPKLKTGGSR